VTLGTTKKVGLGFRGGPLDKKASEESLVLPKVGRRAEAVRGLREVRGGLGGHFVREKFLRLSQG